MEAPGTAPGSETLMPRGVYRHSRFPDIANIGALRAFLKARAVAVFSPWKGLPVAHRVRGQMALKGLWWRRRVLPPGPGCLLHSRLSP